MDDIENRVMLLARYVINTQSTVRQTARQFGISKSTVHKDITYRLKNIDTHLFFEVEKVLKTNLAERHIRGGEATRIKYLTEINL